MGQFNDMLNQLFQVEADGFNPYVDSYSARIGQLQAVTSPDIPETNNAGSQPYDPNKAAANLNKQLTPEEQKLAVEKLNKDLAEEDQLVINPTGGISFKKEKPHTYKFEIGRNQYKQGNDKNVYLRRDLTTGDSIAYDTREAYDKALEEYKKVTGLETTNYL